ncbi:MAG: hypothetical protein WD403_12100, partial [Pirellulales bacterium]
MNRQTFVRRLVYVLLIAALIVPLSFFSQPATPSMGPGRPATPGGRLAQLRDEHSLGQANLGEIDPASETIKLATLGLKGVAANILWGKANKYKVHEDWTSLSATLDQLSKLQPNYISVWRFQGWNLSYNVSVEWDDYRDRYFWVKEGIKFLDKGTRYNTGEPRLIYDMGWFTGHKIGRSDEHVQFRQLFAKDDDDVYPNHSLSLRPQNRRDNWLVAQEYFRRAQQMVDDDPALLRTMNPLTFHSEPAMCQINYSGALEEEGTFGEKARISWEEALREWEQYGARNFLTSSGHTVRLNDLEMYQHQAAELKAELEDLDPGLRERIVAEKRAALTAAERDALEMPFEARNQDDFQRAFNAMRKLAVTHEDVAKRIAGPDKGRAAELAKKAALADAFADAINHEREIVNFEYWRMRCQVERTPAALEARRLIYEAGRLYDEAALEQAREAYEKAFVLWREIVDEHPRMLSDTIGSDSVMI